MGSSVNVHLGLRWLKLTCSYGFYSERFFTLSSFCLAYFLFVSDLPAFVHNEIPSGREFQGETGVWLYMLLAFAAAHILWDVWMKKKERTGNTHTSSIAKAQATAYCFFQSSLTIVVQHFPFTSRFCWNKLCIGSFWIRCDFKGIVHPKMKICWKFTHPQAIQDVDEFVFSSEQIWRNLELDHLLISRSTAMNGCRQNAHIADKNITIINNKSIIMFPPVSIPVVLSHQNPLTYMFRMVLYYFHL